MGIGLGRGQAGNDEDGFAALFAGLQVDGFALDAADLSDMGEVDILVQRRAREQLASLQAAVALIEGLGAPGGNRSGP
jgi:hypothetical protein